MKLSPTEIFKGKKIFFIGGTGFVGKVTLSMLPHNWSEDTLVLMSPQGEQISIAQDISNASRS